MDPMAGHLGVLMVDLMVGRSGVRKVGPMEDQMEERLEVCSAAQREAHLGVRLVAMQAQQVEEGVVLQPWSVGLGATKAVLQPIRVEEIL